MLGSKSQNRLVGIVIIIGFGIISLLALLSSNKKPSQEMFTVSPFLPKFSNSSDNVDVLLPDMEEFLKGQVWVVQLGALKNASKVLEIVSKLRLSGYRVYTCPLQPVQGQITRIYVGPEISREKLQLSLHNLHQLSGLSGQLHACSVG